MPSTKTLLRSIISIIAIITINNTHAQIQLTKNAQPTSRIITSNNTKEERTAANILQSFLQKISGAKLTIIQTSTYKPNDIILNNSDHNKEIKEDGFQITTTNHQLRISGTGGNAVIYGAVSVLEQYLKVDYWGEHEYSFTKNKNISIPSINFIDNPAFRYRQSQLYAMATDTLYRYWHRLKEPASEFAGGYWVHTFDKLLPSEQYGQTHPEYYAFFNGSRHPGKASQWCLSNPDVFEIVSQRIDSIFKANPGKRIISVSQNDGNFTNCTCDQCKAIDDYEGALSGSIITFLNKLAKRFPDKEFSTLAYLYSMHPPKHIKPLPNVNIMLCDIDCNREVPLTENASGRDFVKALQGWSAISNNIFVWDYGINFDNYVSPFPNLHVLQPNIQLFKEHHATRHFSQVGGSRGGDFAELRTYLVAKLMWNPNLDMDSLLHHFLDGYYGRGGAYLYQYIKLMEGALLGSGLRLWIYDSPVSHKAGMLQPQLMRRYNALFDEAEKAVASDTTILYRIQRSRLPLQYAALELARTDTTKDYNSITQQLNLFEARVKQFNIPTLNERSNAPVDYCQLYRSRYMPRAEKNLAAGATVSYSPALTKRYEAISKTALTDGLFGGSTFVESWIGWEGTDAEIVIDMGETKTIHRIEADFLHQLGAWILLPKQVQYSVSTNGQQYTVLQTHTVAEDRSPQVKFVGLKTVLDTPISIRYIKLQVTATKTCPPWHYGVGHTCWFFLDEVTVL